jgi:hypothetical protein
MTRLLLTLVLLLVALPCFAGPLVPVLVGLEDRNQTQGVDQLVRIDPNTGVGTLIGSLGDSFKDCEALCNPHLLFQLFAVDDHRLVQVNPVTGAGNFIADLGVSDVDGLFASPDGGLLGVSYGSNKLIHVALPSNTVSVVAEHVLEGHRLNDLALVDVGVVAQAVPPALLFILTDDTPSRVYQVDPATGANLRRWILSGATSLEALVPTFLFNAKADDTAGFTFLSAGDRDGFKDLVRITLPDDNSGVGTADFVGPLHSGFKDIEALAFVQEPLVNQLEAALHPPTGTSPLAGRFRLQQNSPNPFNPTTQITFVLARPAPVDLSVYDSAGRIVATLVRGPLGAGPHQVLWSGRSANGDPVAAGVYRYTLRSPDARESRSMVLIK